MAYDPFNSSPSTKKTQKFQFNEEEDKRATLYKSTGVDYDKDVDGRVFAKDSDANRSLGVRVPGLGADGRVDLEGRRGSDDHIQGIPDTYAKIDEAKGRRSSVAAIDKGNRARLDNFDAQHGATTQKVDEWDEVASSFRKVEQVSYANEADPAKLKALNKTRKYMSDEADRTEFSLNEIDAEIGDHHRTRSEWMKRQREAIGAQEGDVPEIDDKVEIGSPEWYQKIEDHGGVVGGATRPALPSPHSGEVMADSEVAGTPAGHHRDIEGVGDDQVRVTDTAMEPVAEAQPEVAAAGGDALSAVAPTWDKFINSIDEKGNPPTALAQSEWVVNRLSEIDNSLYEGAGEKGKAMFDLEKETLMSELPARIEALSDFERVALHDNTRDATVGEWLGNFGARTAASIGTGLVDMADFGHRNFLRFHPVGILSLKARNALLGTDDTATNNAGARFFDAMREVAEDWGPEVPQQVREKLLSGKGTMFAEGLGSALSFMIPGGAVAKLGKIAGLSPKALKALSMATTGVAGGAASGNALRREVVQTNKHVLDQATELLSTGEIDREQFDGLTKQMRNQADYAEGLGALIGTSEMIGIGSILGRLNDVGGSALSKFVLQKILKGGASEGVDKGLNKAVTVAAEAMAEMTEEAMQEYGQSVAENAIASGWGLFSDDLAWDHDRELMDGVVEASATGGAVGLTLSLITSAMPGRARKKFAQQLEAEAMNELGYRLAAQKAGPKGWMEMEEGEKQEAIDKEMADMEADRQAAISKGGDATPSSPEMQKISGMIDELMKTPPAEGSGIQPFKVKYTTEQDSETGATMEREVEIFATSMDDALAQLAEQGIDNATVEGPPSEATPFEIVPTTVFTDKDGNEETIEGNPVEAAKKLPKGFEAVGVKPGEPVEKKPEAKTEAESAADKHVAHEKEEDLKKADLMLEQVEQNAPFTEEQNAELDALVERYPEVKAKHDAIAKKVQGSNEVQNENEPVEELGQDDDEVKAPVDPVIAATLKKGRETGGISPESKDEARKAIHHNFKPTKKGSAAIDQVLDTLERVVGQDAFKKVKIVFADKNALAVAGIKNRAGGWASKGEGGVLMLNKDAPENKGDGIVETLFHEVGHGIAEGIDDFISKEFNSLTPEQRKAAALEYDKKDTRSDAELMADKNTRQEWFNFQLFRVAKAGPEAYMKDHGISDKFAEKVVSVWNELREMVTQWIGDSSLSTEALDAKIEDLLFSGNFDQAATAEAAAGQKELDAKAKDDPYADFSGDLKMEPNDETLLPMARSTNQSVRQAVAEYEGATENALLALVEDGLYPMDAKRALSNPNATQKVLEAGIDHADPEVHAQAQDIIIENGKAEQARFAEEDANRKRGDKRRPKKGPTFLSEEGFRKFHEWEFYTERVADPLDPKEVASIRKKHGDSYAEAFIQGFKDGKIRAGNTEDEQASSERVVLDRYEVNEHGVVLNPESVELLSSKKDKVSLIVEYAETKDGRVAAAFGLQKEYGNSHGVSSGVSDKSGAVVADVNAAKVNAIEYALRILKGDDTISPGAHKKHAPKAIAKLEAMLADLPTPPTPPKKKAKAPAKPKKGEMAFTEAPSDMPAVMTMKESDRYIWQHVNEEADLMRAWEAGAALYEVRGNDTEFPRVTDVSQLKPGGSIMVAKDRDGPQTLSGQAKRKSIDELKAAIGNLGEDSEVSIDTPTKQANTIDIERITSTGAKAYERDLKVSAIAVNVDVPQFKADADPITGVVDGDALQGNFDQVQAGRIIVWQKADNKLEVISGRHRLDLAKRAGVEKIASFVFRERDGFSLEDAIMLDAEFNIRDGNGKVKDYAHYFKQSGISKGEAIDRGLLARNPQRKGWSIGQEAVQGLYDLYANGQIAEAKIVAIASAAPANEAAQMLAAKKAKTMTADGLRFYTQNLARLEGIDSTDAKQAGFDEFFDDFASIEAEAEAEATTQSQMIKSARDQINAGKSAAKNPAAAKKLGVDVSNPAATKKQIAELEARVASILNPDTVMRNEIRVRAGLKPLASETEEVAKPEDPNQDSLFGDNDDFGLTNQDAPDSDALLQAELDKAEAEKNQTNMFDEPTQAPKAAPFDRKQFLADLNNQGWSEVGDIEYKATGDTLSDKYVGLRTIDGKREQVTEAFASMANVNKALSEVAEGIREPRKMTPAKAKKAKKETSYFRGDEIEFTGKVDGDLREFVYLEGFKKGEKGHIATKAKQAEMEAEQADRDQSQRDGAKRLDAANNPAPKKSAAKRKSIDELKDAIGDFGDYAGTPETLDSKAMAADVELSAQWAWSLQTHAVSFDRSMQDPEEMMLEQIIFEEIAERAGHPRGYEPVDTVEDVMDTFGNDSDYATLSPADQLARLEQYLVDRYRMDTDKIVRHLKKHGYDSTFNDLIEELNMAASSKAYTDYLMKSVKSIDDIHREKIADNLDFANSERYRAIVYLLRGGVENEARLKREAIEGAESPLPFNPTMAFAPETLTASEVREFNVLAVRNDNGELTTKQENQRFIFLEDKIVEGQKYGRVKKSEYSLTDAVDDIRAGRTNSPLKAINEAVKDAVQHRADLSRRSDARKVDRQRGKLAILDNITRSAKQGKVTKEAAQALTSFVNAIEDRFIDDVAVSIRKAGQAQGTYDFADSLVTMFRTASSLEKTGIHEFWHSLSRLIPESEVQKMADDYATSLMEYLKENPEFFAFVGRETISLEQFDEMSRFTQKANLMDQLKPEYDQSGELVRYRIGFTDENYRYHSLDEWIAEKMTDETMQVGDGLEPNTVMAKIIVALRRFMRLVKRHLGMDAYHNLYNAVFKTPDVLGFERFGPVSQATPLYDGGFSFDDMAYAPASHHVETPQFKKFFGNSKVVDENGDPLVVYHGSEADIAAFELQGEKRSFTNAKGFKRTMIGDSGFAYWFAPSPDKIRAGHNFRSKSSKGVIYPTYLSIKNPLIIDDDTREIWESAVESRDFPLLISEEAMLEVKAEGYDGVFYLDQGKTWDGDVSSLDEVIAFEPTQIKSATGNNGSYDIADGRMAFAPETDRDQILIGLEADAKPAPKKPSAPLYRSGASTDALIDAYINTGANIGVDAQTLRPGHLEKLGAYAAKGGKVFVDSGAFGVRQRGGEIDFYKLFQTYDKLIAAAGKTGAKNLSLVMPDVIGDQIKTIKLLGRHSKRVNGFVKSGVRTIVAAQTQGGDMTLSDLHDTYSKMFGEGVTIGIPSKMDATPKDKVVNFFRETKPKNVHLLGIGSNKRTSQYLELLDLASPDTNLTTDSTWHRAKVGQGRPITERRDELLNEGTDETELGGEIWFDGWVPDTKDLNILQGVYGGTIEQMQRAAASNQLPAYLDTIDPNGDLLFYAAKALNNQSGDNRYTREAIEDLVVEDMAFAPQTALPMPPDPGMAIYRAMRAEKKGKSKKQQDEIYLKYNAEYNVRNKAYEKKLAAWIEKAPDFFGWIRGKGTDYELALVVSKNTTDEGPWRSTRFDKGILTPKDQFHPLGHAIRNSKDEVIRDLLKDYGDLHGSEFLTDMAFAPATAEAQVYNKPFPKAMRGKLNSAAESMADAGINTPEELAQILAEEFGGRINAHSQTLWNFIAGYDESGVAMKTPNPDWASLYGDGTPPTPPQKKKIPVQYQKKIDDQFAEPAMEIKMRLKQSASNIAEVLAGKTSMAGDKQEIERINALRAQWRSLLDSMMAEPQALSLAYVKEAGIFDILNGPDIELSQEQDSDQNEDSAEGAAFLKKIGLTVTKDTTKNGKPVWLVQGKTFDYKEMLKSEFGAKWYRPKTAWSIYNDEDPTAKIAAAIKSGGTGKDSKNESSSSGDVDEAARLKQLREREDSRRDERKPDGDASKSVSAETGDLIKRGTNFGIPQSVVDDQVEDVGMIVDAFNKDKGLFILANGAGTGKTFVLGGVMRELRDQKIVYVTMNTDLIAQIQKDLADFGIDDVQFTTYASLSRKDSSVDTEGAVLIYDESHNVKNAEGSKRGKAAQLQIDESKFTIIASATPFENPVQAEYLKASGVFDVVGNFPTWAKMYGADSRLIKNYNGPDLEIVMWKGGKKEDGAAAREWFFRQGIMTQRPMVVPVDRVINEFSKFDASAEYVELYNKVDAAYEDAMGEWTDENGVPLDARVTSGIAMHKMNMLKRLLEAAKMEETVRKGNEWLGKTNENGDPMNLVIFVETKSDRHIGRYRRSGAKMGDTLYAFPEMQRMMNEWEQEKSTLDRGERGPPAPFAGFIVEIARAMHASGIDQKLPSVETEMVEAFGGKSQVAVYTGSVTNAKASQDKVAFLAGQKRVLVATMAKGGTGLSLHDTVGNRPTVQLNINLPWVATGVEQVSFRVARYGMQSNVNIDWLFAGNLAVERDIANRVGRRMRDMGAVVSGVDLDAANVLTDDWEFDGSRKIKKAEKIKTGDDVDSDEDIYQQANRLERARRKASNTSGGFFETPFELSALMTQVSGASTANAVLEPSAGTGNLVRFVPAGVKIEAVEQRSDNFKQLRANLDRYNPKSEVVLNEMDFLEWAKTNGAKQGSFDAIQMNPPFERLKGVGPQDVVHVMEAFKFLAPGGRLVAIMGEGAFFRSAKQETAFREFLQEQGATVVKLPSDAFKNSGTGVNTRMVILDNVDNAYYTELQLQNLEVDSLREVAEHIPSIEIYREGMAHTPARLDALIDDMAYAPRSEGTPTEERIIGETIGDLKDRRTIFGRIRDYMTDLTANDALRFRQGVFDSFASIREYEKNIFGKNSVVDAAASGHKMALMTKNLPSVMMQVMTKGTLEYVNGSVQLKEGSQSLAAILNMVGDKRIKLWEGYVAAVRSKRLIGEGKENNFADDPEGMKDGLTAEQKIDQLLALGEQYPEFEQARLAYQEWNQDLLDFAESAGIINPSTREVWEKNDYVPFYRIAESVDGKIVGPRKNKGLSAQDAGIRQLKGGAGRIAVIENIYKNAEKLVDASFKNIAMQRITDLAEASDGVLTPIPHKAVPFKVAVKEIKDELEKNGVETDGMTDEDLSKMVNFWRMKAPKGEDVVSVSYDGKPKYFKVNDPLLLASILDLGPQEQNPIIRFMGKPKQLLTAGITLDPTFMVANWMRDSLNAYFVSESPLRPGLDSLKGIVDVMAESESYHAIMASGGSSGAYQRLNDKDIRRELSNMTKGHKRKFSASIIDSPHRAINLLKRVGRASEMANRVAVYDAAIRTGATPQEAAYQAMDLTNFTMHGASQVIRTFTTVVPFLNARLQGLYKLGRAGAANPKRFAGHAMVMTAATLALMLKNWDDERYWELEDWDRDLYYHMWFGDEHVRIPKPFEVGAVFSTIPERMTEAIFKRGDADLLMKSMGTTALTTFAFNPIPQAVVPVVEQMWNKSFFGFRPIVSGGDKYKSPEQQFSPWTSEAFREVAKAMPSSAPEWARSPKRLEHMWRGYTGTIGTYVVDMADMLVRQAGDYPNQPDFEGADGIPVLSNMKRRFNPEDGTRSNRHVGEFYKLYNKVLKVEQGIRDSMAEGDKASVDKLQEDNREILAKSVVLKQTSSNMSKLRKQQNAIYFDPIISPKEKAEKLKELNKRRNQIAGRTVRLPDPTR